MPRPPEEVPGCLKAPVKFALLLGDLAQTMLALYGLHELVQHLVR
jgi:hypothetical protein